ncbi:hypothetical protein [Dactylosporangium sp. NPDC005555]|uniref:hypothetical protein n=1 Tax=Dactylosporangium sp. NPDC005555 TaxID=3154889 RepID=UPI00339F54AD
MEDSAFPENGFLLVPWNSVALVDHGDQDAELAGNPPIRVDLRTGKCEYIDLLEAFDYMSRGFMS